MANGAFKFKDNSGNVVSFISGSGSNISFSGGTLDLSGMTGLTLGNLTLSGTTQNALSASHAASYLLTSSFNTYSGTTDTVIGTLQTSTSSLNSFTSSATTRLNSIETSTGSLNSYTSSNTTNVNAIHTSTGSLNTFTSSATTRLDNIETSTGSLNSFTSSATSRLNSIEGVSGSYATTGSNQFKNDQVITGSLTVTGFIDAQELRTTYISSSILYRSGSTKFGDELSDTHAFTGSLLVSGSISVPGSGLISGSSQVLNGSGVFSGSAQLPSGIVSSSAQTIANLPSGTVSGSVQVDVMSTTNIARLATTGSNVFTGAITGTSATFSSTLTISGDIYASNGTSTAASIRFNNANTGFYHPTGTDNLGIITSGTQKAIILANGNVGINVVAPTEKLQVNGSFRFGDSTNYLTSSRDGTGVYMELAGTSTATRQLRIQGINDAGTSYSSIRLEAGASQILFVTADVTRFTIASTGAATFSSSVTATRMVVGGSATSRILQVNTSGNDGIRILTSGDNPTLDLMQTAAANGNARNWRIVSNYEGWGTLDFQSGTNNTNDPSTTRLSLSGVGGTSTFSSNITATAGTFSSDFATLSVIGTNVTSPHIGSNWSVNSNQDAVGRTIISTAGQARAMYFENNGSILIPNTSLSVGGKIYSTSIHGANLVAGNIAGNMPSAPAYILIVDLNNIAGFSLSGKVNAASYTCWNISDIYIQKNYSSTAATAGIEGKFKSGCDFSIVNITYGGGNYIALRFTSNPEIDVLWTGYRLIDLLSGGAFQVITSGVSVNSTYATY